ncbi:MAG: hypothetical protein U9P38_08260 [Campylobacterota bacterium]|nr:hypothetical protein [Campylobacterota bacterium]
MNILTSKLYEKQLKDILELVAQQDYQSAKNFKMYLDTIILNMPTKEKKYKKSIYFDDENIKDISFQGCTIIFFVDKGNSRYIILGITAKS